MGMSASQARLISLEARMSDLEYEGQQINQQRLTLSNKMNEIYASAMDMEVPTAPSKIDYATEGYSGKVGGARYEITMGENGSFRCVKHESGYTCSRVNGYQAPTSFATIAHDYPKNNDDTIDWGTLPTKTGGDGAGLEIDPEKLLSGGYTVFDENNKALDANDLLEGPDANGKYSIKSVILGQINSGAYTVGKAPADQPEKFEDLALLEARGTVPVKNAFAGLDHYIKEWNDANPDATISRDDFKAIVEPQSDGTTLISFVPASGDQTYALQQTIDNDVTTTLEIVNTELDVKGNITGFTVNDGNTTTKVNVSSNSSAYDEIAYDAAFREYERKKIEYDHEQNELNKQTSLYQRQDKQLELKLTRLDNERNALKTEIDAVKKVIQDATESGFKTFSG